jgi:hypothetical protein
MTLERKALKKLHQLDYSMEHLPKGSMTLERKALKRLDQLDYSMEPLTVWN